MEISYTQDFKQQLKRLGKRYRSIEADLRTLLDELYLGTLPGTE